jgi:hypothetical protein
MSQLLNDDAYRILARLLTYFSSSYSYNGRLKLIQTLDSSMNVYTSRSNRIEHQLKCRHRISRLLSVAIQKQISLYHDGGLYLAIAFSSFLLQLREIGVDQQLSSFQTCMQLVDRMKIPFETIDFNSIYPLLAIVRAVLCKSFAYDRSEHIREQLCLLTAKSFLENITMLDLSEQQLTLTIEGLSVVHSELYSGLLYRIGTASSSLHSATSRSCLYFTISLAGDYTIDNIDTVETSQETFQWLQAIVNRLAKQILAYTCLHNGGLILCQKVRCSSCRLSVFECFLKVIHPSIKHILRQNGIDTIDRLTRQYTPYFCYLTGRNTR